jgi:glycogen operon protein
LLDQIFALLTTPFPVPHPPAYQRLLRSYNEISWFDWDLTAENNVLLDFTRQLIQFRQQHAVFRQRDWFQRGSGEGDDRWFQPDGSEISEEQGQDTIKAMSLLLSSGDSPSDDEESRMGDRFLLCFNGEDARVEFCFPVELEDGKWQVVIDTTELHFVEEDRFCRESEVVRVEGRSLIILHDVRNILL